MSIAVDGYEEASAHAKAWQAAFQQTQDEALAQTSVFAVTVNVEPTWSSVDLVNRFMSLVIRLMNFDSMVIFEEAESFEPLFIEREWQDKTALVIDEWCEAYLRGVELTGESWYPYHLFIRAID